MKNEKTSTKVGAIASRMLRTTGRFSASEPLAIVTQRKYGRIAKGTLIYLGRVGELKALAASALTQRPNRPRSPARRASRTSRKGKKQGAR